MGHLLQYTPQQMPQKNLYASPIMPSAVTKIQAHARAKQAKQRIAKLRAERVRDATAYKSYLSSHTRRTTPKASSPGLA